MFDFIELKIRLGEILNFTAAVGIAVYIHFYIKRKLDDSRHLKNLFIEELTTLTKHWHEAMSIIVGSVTEQKIIKDCEKRNINGMINFTDLIIDSVVMRLNSAFDRKFMEEIAEIKEKHFELWKQVTGGELMNTKFVATETFLILCRKKLVTLDLKIRELIIKINKC